MKKLYFLYNPHAGKEQLSGKLNEVLQLYTRSGYEVTIRPTLRAAEAVSLIENLSGDYDLVVCSGGDGTLDEVVTGMMRRTDRIPIGYIPSGSTNDFGYSLGLSKDPILAAQSAIDGVPFPCDMGRMNGDHVWVYVAAFGLFTDVSYETPQEMKNVLGHAAYLLEGARRLGRIRSFPMRVVSEGVEIEDVFIYGMVTNSKSVGGFPNLLNKQNVAFDDGVMEVTLIRKPRNLGDLQKIINSLLVASAQSEYICTFQSRDVTFESEEPVAWTLDGEAGGSHSFVRITCDPKAVRLMLPAESLPKVALDFQTASLKNKESRILRSAESDIWRKE